MKTVRVGILPYRDVKARTVAIARGELKPGRHAPTIWLPSAETLGKILSGANQELLREIRRSRPRSLRELSDRTGRAQSNLSRTLKTMERYGLVQLHRGSGGVVEPRVPYDRMLVEFDIAGSLDD